MKHITVLLDEAVEALALQKGSVVVDATLGVGGHAREILKQLDATGTFVGLDADVTAINALSDLKEAKAKVHLINSNFSALASVLTQLKISEVDAVLADLGWRTEQFASGNKGFSFTDDSALSMTYGDREDYAFDASDIVNHWDEEDIANVLFGYGEERYSRRIAKAIVDIRRKHHIESAAELAEIISQAVPASYRHGRTNPATKSFQALRIAVNDEFAVLEALIAQAWSVLKPNGRLAIISFHSLEDRIVKLAFRSLTHDQQGVLVTKKPITPSVHELAANPRARSAKLRIIQKL